ncbi:MAG: hypothetical protein KBS66_03915, partial [Eubacterium sp.]|nr:hypothetical protein [Candidatus Colimonas fimequi]
ENLSVKLTFDRDMAGLDKAGRDANAKEMALTDPKGKKIAIKAYYSKDHANQVIILSDRSGKDANFRFDDNTEYTLTLGENFASSDGSTLGTPTTISFTTLNQKRSMMIYMGLMVVMMGGMVVFTTRSAKKQMEKDAQERGEYVPVNPYKEAKRTGRPVKEIIEEEAKKKAKHDAALAKRREAEKAIEEELKAEAKKSFNKRVAVRRPISAAGSEYKVTVVKPEPKKAKNTNPKGQTGKQKNKNKKK